MRSSHAAVLATALALTAAGCGSDEKAGDASAPASTPAASTPAAAPKAVTVKLSEFAFTPKDAEAAAGEVTITAPNEGKVVHELVVLRTDADPAHLPMKGSEVDEASSVGEIADVPAGKTKSVTLTLKPGTYAMVCNLPGHYKSGMYGSLTVK